MLGLQYFYPSHRKKKQEKHRQNPEEDESEPPPPKKIFKLLYNSLGNVFYLLILGTTKKVTYDLIKFKRKCGTRMLFSYNYSFVYDPNLTTPYQIIFPKEVYKKNIYFTQQQVSRSYSEPIRCCIILSFCFIS